MSQDESNEAEIIRLLVSIAEDVRAIRRRVAPDVCFQCGNHRPDHFPDCPQHPDSKAPKATPEQMAAIGRAYAQGKTS